MNEEIPEETEIRMHKNYPPGTIIDIEEDVDLADPGTDSVSNTQRPDSMELIDDENGPSGNENPIANGNSGRMVEEVNDQPPARNNNRRQTRSATSTEIIWVQDDAASIVARVTVASVQSLSGQPSESPFAPTALGTLYVELHWSAVKSMFNYWSNSDAKTYEKILEGLDARRASHLPTPPPFADGKIVYVPLAFLHALAKKGSPWVKAEHMKNAANADLHHAAYKVQKEDEFFDENDASFAVLPHDLWMPLRDDLGRLILCRHKGTWSNPTKANVIKYWWTNILLTAPRPTCSSGSSSARYQTIDVGELLVKIMPLGTARFEARTRGAGAVFGHFIAEINKEHKKNGGTVRLLGKDEEVPNTYQLLSEHPFGLYQTYIESTAYDAYLKQLLAGCFETRDQERAVIEELKNPENGKYQGIVDPRGIPKDISKLIKALRPIDAEMKERSQGTTDARADGREAIKLSDKKVKIKEPDTGKTQTITPVDVNAKKAELARGKRKQEKADQATVMGDSASKIAIKYLNWKWTDPQHRAKQLAVPLRGQQRTTLYRTNEMYNGLFIAEWLHLSAYSWGGIANPRDDGMRMESLAGSSQIPENLIIGTSETNSAMTRWEKAWQKLLQAEGKLLTTQGQDGSKYGGHLTITRHPFDTQPLAPTDGNAQKNKINNYTYGPTRTRDKYAHYLHDVAVPTPNNPNSPFRFEQKRLPLTPDLQELTRQFRWVCLSFDYTIRLTGKSTILNLNEGSVMGTNRFYPFKRMLFHKIEHDLDSFLWKDMTKEAVQRIRCHYVDGVVTEEPVPVEGPTPWSGGVGKWQNGTTDGIWNFKRLKTRNENDFDGLLEE